MIDHEERQQAVESLFDGSDDGASNPERSNHGGDEDDNDNDSLQDILMNGWEVFDADAVYQKKRVNPEMRRWILTKACRRIVSNEFFNNPACNQGMCNLLLKN